MTVQTSAKKIAPSRLNVDARQLLSRAWELYGQGYPDKAGALCERLLEDSPGDAETMHLKALVCWHQGDRPQAISLLKQAAERQPDQPRHHNNLGVFLNQEGLHDQAAACLEKAVHLSPHYHDARCNLGLALFHQNKLMAAAHCFKEVITHCPTHGPAYANLGLTLLAQGAHIQAATAYKRALAIDPHQVVWWGNLGAAHLAMDNFSQAAHAFQQALGIDPDSADHNNHLSVALRALGDLEGAVAVLQRALARCPDHPEALSNFCIVLQQTCQWELLEPLLARLDQNTLCALNNKRLPAEQPMYNIWRSTDPGLNLKVARAWSHEAEKRALCSALPYTHLPPACAGQRITVGYLSYDFRNHPVAHQLLPLFGLHNRKRFRVLAFSMRPDDGSQYRARMEHDCDQFIEIGHLDPERSARSIHESNTDILIDLMGHSHHNRLQMMALRPAPLQVGYLGFLASTGAGFIDYLIADDVVVPQAHNDLYTEKLIRMPHCYQMNHNLFFPSALCSSRADWGLPPQGFIFCCFNSAYKINATLFGAWIAILKQVPGSVLWLFRDNAMAETQLKKMAVQMGLEPHRLIFADKAPLPDHIQRLQLADLALDTDGYNGGATTANALWAGVPVLTVLGTHWVSRMSASHLMTAGIPELVAANLEAYTQSAIRLAMDPTRLQALRAQLNYQKLNNPLFNAGAFVRDLETGFEMIWKRHCNGLAPAHVRVPPSATR
jgi:protein O-GlcNAc transferase